MADYYGNILKMVFAKTEDGIVYSDATTQGEKTFCTKIGVLLGWICIAGFLGFLPLTIILRIK